MIARLALAAIALALVAVLATRIHHHSACDAARSTIFAVTLGHEPLARQVPAIAAVRATCRGTTALLSAAGALHQQGRDGQALALAQEAAGREPGNAAAWRAVEAAAAGAQAPALARAADRRLSTLDPLGRPSLNLSTGRSIR